MENLEKYFVEDTRNNTYNEDVKTVGKLVKVFKGHKFRFTQNKGKRATFVFQSKENERKFRTVFLSKRLQEMFEMEEITKAQLWSCNVIIMDIKDPETGKVVANNAFVLEKPLTGWEDVDSTTWEEFNSDDIA